MRVCQFRHFGTERFGAATGSRTNKGQERARQTGSEMILSHSSPRREGLRTGLDVLQLQVLQRHPLVRNTLGAAARTVF
jgi:hypothetical protein